MRQQCLCAVSGASLGVSFKWSSTANATPTQRQASQHRARARIARPLDAVPRVESNRRSSAPVYPFHQYMICVVSVVHHHLRHMLRHDQSNSLRRMWFSFWNACSPLKDKDHAACQLWYTFYRNMFVLYEAKRTC